MAGFQAAVAKEQLPDQRSEPYRMIASRAHILLKEIRSVMNTRGLDQIERDEV